MKSVIKILFFFIGTICFILISPIQKGAVGENVYIAATDSELNSDVETESESSESHIAPETTVAETMSLEEALAAYDPDTSPFVSLPPSEDAQISCTNGIMTYFSQEDPRWADSLYGPSDRMGSYGCSPTAIAMIVNSFTQYKVTPPDTAKWANDNGYCIRGQGSLHALIPDGLRNYGLSVTSLKDRSVENVVNEIRNGNIVVALMDKGYFTNGGHFLLLTRVDEEGLLYIADPVSWNNSVKGWEPEFVLSQIRPRADAGGPLWSVSIPVS